MKKMATKLAITTMAACAVGTLSAPLATAAPASEGVETWVVRLDPMSTKILAGSTPQSLSRDAMRFATHAKLPRDVQAATFIAWGASLFSEQALDQSPNACLEFVATLDSERPLYGTGVSYPHCPWKTPSAIRR